MLKALHLGGFLEAGRSLCLAGPCSQRLLAGAPPAPVPSSPQTQLGGSQGS